MSDERNALDPLALHRGGLDDELEIRDLRVRGQPGAGGGQHAALLLRVDHLEGVPEGGSPLLLHFDDHHTTTTPENEVELIATYACVGVKQPIAAKPIVAESAALAAIHAAS